MGIFETLEDRRLLSASPVAAAARLGTVSALARTGPGVIAELARSEAPVTTLAAGNGGQSNFPPGQFPAGNPGQAPGNSNSPGNSGKMSTGGQSNFPPGQFPAGNPAQAPGNSNTPGNSGK